MATAGADPDSPETLGAAAAPRTPVTNRDTITRQKVILAAVQVIDTEGLRQFTLRRVAQVFGVETMALYHYISSREALLDAVVEHVIDELYGDPDVHLHTDNWPDYLVRLAHGVRRIALAHPLLFPLIATRPPAAPWVKPPLRSLRWMESFLQTLRDCGFGPAASVAAYRAFSSLLLGHLLLEVSTHGAETSPIEQEPPGRADPADLSNYPVLLSLEKELTEDHAAEEFEVTLEMLLDRLDLMKPASAQQRRRHD
ncbi:DNA-binding transcriptional regulator, AcrR family [Nakamurella panacisegetis]|uniref:DNA-binding transcriptional regulator, AcrR family n=1 Tax=Nakamurella panacisegetis TaxID=1090615 RepID=A0A1H0RFI4_9ACTN|nr:TetR/AcrR family transcriptional regulator C-terminal domain-containing protein [Nakamurella panacisegetis]SDP28382.1 DNA-binding transcriptional regulator, AcrR family [Nakamurella panacisegetis]